MRLKEIYSVLDRISPFELQESWDNSGLQVGDWNQEIENIYLCVDVDEELIDSLPPRSLLVTHHPLIFGKLRSIEYNSYPSKLLVPMIKKDIVHIAMHTNFDKTHLGRYVAKNVLGVQARCEEFVCYFEKEGSFEELLEWVKGRFGLVCPRYVPTSKKIKKVAMVTGSGGSLMDRIDADLFLTGDLKYHDAMKAKVLGLGVIDIGHFESECYFSDALQEQLKKESIKAIIATIKNPLKAQ